jgi:Rps23 Pro-64 3,4-dihydroxylase Tpa1-like proline 4-hydroxylase
VDKLVIAPGPNVDTVRHHELRIDAIRDRVDALAREFATAAPFRHIVLDGSLDIDRREIESFPGLGWPHWRELGDTYQHGKRTCQDRSVIPSPWGELIDELNSPPFLRLLERITGIAKLIPDPYLEGGGLHLSAAGGILAPHTDFHLYGRLGLYRRLNVLVYLNPDWAPGDGGVLTLAHAHHPERGRRQIEPAWGRIVAFETNDVSVHGFPVPVAPGQCRRSIATYYYTSTDTVGFSGDFTTHWRDHGRIRRWQRPRFWISRLLMQTSRGFSLLSHLLNPNQGVGWRRRRIRPPMGKPGSA